MKSLHKDHTVIYLISLLALGFLTWLVYFAPVIRTQSSLVAYLPLSNSICNSLCSLFLIVGYRFIKQGEKEKHKICMRIALTFSALFLVGYISYHTFHGDTKYLGQGPLRYIYFFILISHILLSVITFPMVLITFYHAHKENWVTHKKIAKITFPLWLYVSITGVLIYLLLHQLN
jgi:putative membrane protein